MPKVHIVRQGEYLAKIAKDHKLAHWETIYNHPENAAFRKKRPNPNVICPDDRIVIPDMEIRTESIATEQRHKFRTTTIKLLVRVIVRDGLGEVMANEPYVLKIEDKEYRGSTDGQGLLEQEITVDAQQGILRLEKKKLSLPLAIGQLDPIDDHDESSKIVTGAQARLNNLGFACGKVDGDEGDKTKDAIRAFQKQVLKREEPDGILDKETRDALIREHGC